MVKLLGLVYLLSMNTLSNKCRNSAKIWFSAKTYIQLIIWKRSADFAKECIFYTAYFAKECYFSLRSIYFTRIISFGEVPEESHGAAACKTLLRSLPLWRTLRCALDLFTAGTTSTEPNFGASSCSFGKSQGTKSHSQEQRRMASCMANPAQHHSCGKLFSASPPGPGSLHSDPAQESKPGQTIYLQKKHFCHLSFARKKPPLTPHQAHSAPAANQETRAALGHFPPFPISKTDSQAGDFFFF